MPLGPLVNRIQKVVEIFYHFSGSKQLPLVGIQNKQVLLYMVVSRVFHIFSVFLSFSVILRYKLLNSSFFEFIIRWTHHLLNSSFVEFIIRWIHHSLNSSFVEFIIGISYFKLFFLIYLFLWQNPQWIHFQLFRFSISCWIPMNSFSVI